MRQLGFSRPEEYVTLRDEVRELLRHGRFILYVTSGFIFGSMAWYLSRTSTPQLSPAAFAGFLYSVLVLSSLIYINSLSQAFRIGGYIAVFWESRDIDRRLKWHRFNRRGASGGFLTGSAQLAYAALTLTIVGFLVHSLETFPNEQDKYVTFAVIAGMGMTLMFARIRTYLRSQQQAFEREWRLIRASQERQNEIHDQYETVPEAIVQAGRLTRDAIAASLIILGLAAGFLVSPLLMSVISPPPPAISPVIELRIEQLEKRTEKAEQQEETMNAVREELRLIIKELRDIRKQIPQRSQRR